MTMQQAFGSQSGSLKTDTNTRPPHSATQRSAPRSLHRPACHAVQQPTPAYSANHGSGAAHCVASKIRNVTANQQQCSRSLRGVQGDVRCLAAAYEATQAPVASAEGQVLAALSRIIDPDFGQDIVTCGFVKDLTADEVAGSVYFRLQLTTPACPVKGEFERQARQYVGELPWVQSVDLKFDSLPPQPLQAAAGRPGGLARVKHVIAVSSCKGGVGKSTTAVNLAYTLLQMGGRVGILDADVYGPSLPTMISPEIRVLKMDPITKALTPVEYEGVKAVSFGFAGQGSAIMRGAMTSGLTRQLLETPDWGELDYLVVDFPPGTGDIQLTLLQEAAFSAAVIVTTPSKLAYVDVVKGIRMFARLQVPCVAVAENQSYIDCGCGLRHTPFGTGSGDRIQQEFGIPHLVKFPLREDISAAGDGGKPFVISDPASDTAGIFMELGAAVVREVSKLEAMPKNAVRYDASVAAFAVSLPSGIAPGDARPLAQPADASAAAAEAAAATAEASASAIPPANGSAAPQQHHQQPQPANNTSNRSDITSSNGAQASDAIFPVEMSGTAAPGAVAADSPQGRRQQEFYLDPALVRRNDTSASALDEWTGERLTTANIPDDIKPADIAPCGNYAVQILWDDGFNQVTPFELLASLERLTAEQLWQRAAAVSATAAENGAALDVETGQ